MNYQLILVVLLLLGVVLLNERTRRRPATIDSLIHRDGWTIDQRGWLLPPDKTRQGWGAVWEAREYKGRKVFVPHYANLI